MENENDPGTPIRGADDLIPPSDDALRVAAEEATTALRSLVDPATHSESSAEMARMLDFLVSVKVKVDTWKPEIVSHYRAELRAICRDIERDLGLDELSDVYRAQMISMFIIEEDDDDGDEEAPATPTPPREEAPAG